MPFLNEHSCRVRNPNNFEPNSFRSISPKKGIRIIIGKLKGQNTTATQTIRMDKDIYTEEEARKLCTEEGGIFEPAKK